MTRGEQETLQQNAQAIAHDLKCDKDIRDDDVAETTEQATEAMNEGSHPERGTTYGVAAISNLSIVLVGAATASAFVPVGLTIGGATGGYIGGTLTLAAVETLKKTPLFANAWTALGLDAERLVKAAGDGVAALPERLAPFKAFVVRNERPLREIAGTTRQLRWMTPYIDFIVQDKSGETGTRPPS